MNTSVSVLVELINGVKGCQFGTINYEAKVSIPKKYGIEGMVTKVVNRQIAINYSYENAVNNRLEKIGAESNFVAESLPWGHWLSVNKIIEHKGNYYLRAYVVENTYKCDVRYLVNGVTASVEQADIIAEYERTKNKGSQKQTDAGLAEHQVKPMSIAFEGIRSIKVNGQVWER